MKRKKRVLPWLLPTVIIFCLICFCFVINQWNVDIVLQGESEITLECGQSYTDPGAEAFFGGTIFPDHLFSLKLDIDDQVDYQHPGVYKIEYSAGLLWYQSTVVRTLTLQDTLAPELVLKEDQNGYTLPGHPYEEPGFTATDLVDGDLTDAVIREERDGKIYYSVTDSSGNTATAVREINYNDPLPPEITLMGEETMELPAGTPYEEPGFRAEDNCDGDLTPLSTLTELEYRIVLLLASYPNKIFSAENLYESIWEEPYFYSCKNTVMVHIRNIRQKVGSGAICTVWGKGYRMGPSKP